MPTRRVEPNAARAKILVSIEDQCDTLEMFADVPVDHNVDVVRWRQQILTIQRALLDLSERLDEHEKRKVGLLPPRGK